MESQGYEHRHLRTSVDHMPHGPPTALHTRLPCNTRVPLNEKQKRNAFYISDLHSKLLS